MKALIGMVSLLVCLAIVGMLALRQIKSAGQTAAITSASQSVSPSALPASATITPREQPQAIQQRVADDLAKAMNQAAETRKSAEDK